MMRRFGRRVTNTFLLHGVDAQGVVTVRRTVSRGSTLTAAGSAPIGAEMSIKILVMQSPFHLIFESSAFPPAPGEDEETNPGIYGRALSAWLAGKLPSLGYVVKRVVAEDFGRLIEVAQPGMKLYVAVSSTDDTAVEWRVFAFSESGFLDKLRGARRGPAAVSDLMTAVKRILSENADVRGLREEAV